MWNYKYTDELYHYGVKGMKWGKRKARYSQTSGTRSGKTKAKQTEDAPKKKGLSKNAKRAIAIGAALAAYYGTYKVHQFVRKKNTQIRLNQAMDFLEDYRKDHGYMDYNIHKLFASRTIDRYYDLSKKESFVSAAKNVIKNRNLSLR